jgi:hypothetical protein
LKLELGPIFEKQNRGEPKLNETDPLKNVRNQNQRVPQKLKNQPTLIKTK